MRPGGALSSDGANTDAVAYERLKFVDRWFAYLHSQGIAQPTETIYLEYLASARSPEPLKDVHEAFRLIELPAVPSIAIELPNAITTKRILCSKRPRGKKRQPPVRRMSIMPGKLPAGWREALAAMPAPSIVKGIETAPCQYAHRCLVEGRSVELTTEGTGTYIQFLEKSSSPRGTPRRSATLEMRISALRVFADYVSAPAEVIEALQVAKAHRRKETARTVALKYKAAAEVGAVRTVLASAVDLLRESRADQTVTWRMTKLNHATRLAMFVLLPVRLSDICLVWGKHIGVSDAGYTIDVIPNKTGERISGILPAFLTSFLDALLLRGLDETYLQSRQDTAIREQRPLVAKRTEAAIFKSYVRRAWRTHLGTAAYLSDVGADVTSFAHPLATGIVG